MSIRVYRSDPAPAPRDDRSPRFGAPPRGPRPEPVQRPPRRSEPARPAVADTAQSRAAMAALNAALARGGAGFESREQPRFDPRGRDNNQARNDGNRFDRNDRNDQFGRNDRRGDFDAPRMPPRAPQQHAPPRAPSRPQPRISSEVHAAAANGVPTERLNKRMAALGMASRREADEWIDRGFVTVNGIIARMGQQVVESDVIDISLAARREQEQQVTILLNKPIGYVSGQAEDGHPPAITLIADSSMNSATRGRIRFENWHLKHLAPAGRLDIDSTGLLVLTQDGRVARAIIGEASDMEKEYLVRVEYEGAPEMGIRQEALGEAAIEPIEPHHGGNPASQIIKKNVQSVFPHEGLMLLRQGLSLDGEELLPAKVSWQNEEQLRFVLREGKKRQIRRMCEAVGLKVVGLKRIRIGRVVLGDLPLGQWRYLQPFEKF